MDWIFDHLKFVVIIVFVVGSFLKSRFEAKTRESADLPDFGDGDAPDKSYRKMPPPLTPASVPPPIPTTTCTIPGAFEAAENEAAKILRHQRDLAEHLRQIRATKATTTGGAAVTRARVAAGKSKAKPFAAGPISLRARLRDPAEVKRAFIMREILDKPVGLR